MSDSALRGLDLLEHVAHFPGLTVGEIAKQLAMSRATVARLLDSLERGGWLIPEGRPRRYFPALRVVSSASAVLKHNQAREQLRPWLLELAERTSLPCSLGFYERGRVVITDVSEVVAERLVSRFDGESYPAACTAGGKILLAFQSADEIKRVAALGVESLTPTTTTTPASIEEEARVTRERGYSLTNLEFRADASGLGVPVKDKLGRVAAALVVSTRGPIIGEFVETIGQIALDVAARASLALGHSPSASLGIA